MNQDDMQASPPSPSADDCVIIRETQVQGGSASCSQGDDADTVSAWQVEEQGVLPLQGGSQVQGGSASCSEGDDADTVSASQVEEQGVLPLQGGSDTVGSAQGGSVLCSQGGDADTVSASQVDVQDDLPSQAPQACSSQDYDGSHGKGVCELAGSSDDEDFELDDDDFEQYDIEFLEEDTASSQTDTQDTQQQIVRVPFVTNACFKRYEIPGCSQEEYDAQPSRSNDTGKVVCLFKIAPGVVCGQLVNRLNDHVRSVHVSGVEVKRECERQRAIRERHGKYHMLVNALALRDILKDSPDTHTLIAKLSAEYGFILEGDLTQLPNHTIQPAEAPASVSSKTPASADTAPKQMWNKYNHCLSDVNNDPLLQNYASHNNLMSAHTWVNKSLQFLSRLFGTVQSSLGWESEHFDPSCLQNITAFTEYFAKAREYCLPTTCRMYTRMLLHFLRYLDNFKNLGEQTSCLKKLMNELSGKLGKDISISKHRTSLEMQDESKHAMHVQNLHANITALQDLEAEVLKILTDLPEAHDNHALPKKSVLPINRYIIALLALKHCQRPSVSEGMTVSEWMNRVTHKNGTIISVFKHKTGASRPATVFLNSQESKIFEQYFNKVRGLCVRAASCQGIVSPRNFILNEKGLAFANNHSNVLAKWQEQYQVPRVTATQARKLFETQNKSDARKGIITEAERSEMTNYLAHSVRQADANYVQDTAEMAARTADNVQSMMKRMFEETEMPEGENKPNKKRPACEMDTDDEVSDASIQSSTSTASSKRSCKGKFSLQASAFLKRDYSLEDSNFPYKAAEEAGIQESEMRSVVNRWRYDRKLDRVKHIAEMFKRRRTMPAPSEIQRELKRCNYPMNFESDVTKCIQKTILDVDDKRIDKRTEAQIKEHIKSQRWPGLSISDSKIAGAGRGVHTTTSFNIGDVVCDYHGTVITDENVIKEIETTEDERLEYSFFFSHKNQRHVIDAFQQCECHEELTFGRLINHSTRPNIKPKLQVIDEQPVLLFHALRRLDVGLELLFDYNDKKSNCDWMKKEKPRKQFEKE